MIDPNETSIVGEWLLVDNQLVADSLCSRIENLVAGYLERLAVSPDGWSTLYRDPSDGRLWEHYYPKSELHGGGPPTLKVIDKRNAMRKYRVEAGSVGSSF